MIKRALISAAMLAICAASGAVWAEGPQQPQPIKLADNTPIYGSQLMSQQERIEFRNKMRSAQSQEERDQIRAEHHAKMQARAKEKGVTLPDTPPPIGSGRGMGPGSGMGGGMGPRP